MWVTGGKKQNWGFVEIKEEEPLGGTRIRKQRQHFGDDPPPPPAKTTNTKKAKGEQKARGGGKAPVASGISGISSVKEQSRLAALRRAAESRAHELAVQRAFAEHRQWTQSQGGRRVVNLDELGPKGFLYWQGSYDSPDEIDPPIHIQRRAHSELRQAAWNLRIKVLGRPGAIYEYNEEYGWENLYFPMAGIPHASSLGGAERELLDTLVAYGIVTAADMVRLTNDLGICDWQVGVANQSKMLQTAKVLGVTAPVDVGGSKVAVVREVIVREETQELVSTNARDPIKNTPVEVANNCGVENGTEDEKLDLVAGGTSETAPSIVHIAESESTAQAKDTSGDVVFGSFGAANACDPSGDRRERPTGTGKIRSRNPLKK